MQQGEWTTLALPDADGTVLLAAPSVGMWRSAVQPGMQVALGARLGTLSSLGRAVPLHASGAGTVLALPSGAAGAVEFGTPLVRLGQRQHALAGEPAPQAMQPVTSTLAAVSLAEDEFAFTAPMGGRFFWRPTPADAPFVAVGDRVQAGTPLAILEIMKTFHRLHYAAAPYSAAIVVRLVAVEGSDVRSGETLLILRPAGA